MNWKKHFRYLIMEHRGRIANICSEASIQNQRNVVYYLQVCAKIPYSIFKCFGVEKRHFIYMYSLRSHFGQNLSTQWNEFLVECRTFLL